MFVVNPTTRGLGDCRPLPEQRCTTVRDEPIMAVCRLWRGRGSRPYANESDPTGALRRGRRGALWLQGPKRTDELALVIGFSLGR